MTTIILWTLGTAYGLGGIADAVAFVTEWICPEFPE